MKKETVLITGVAGFIGSHVADAFINQGYIVVGVDNLLTGSIINIPKKVIFYNLNLNKPKKLIRILKKHQPTYIIHHASNLVNVSFSLKYPWKAYQDIVMTSHLLEAAKRFGAKHIVFASSANVYAHPPKLPITESSSINPVSPYGLTKLAIENHLKYFCTRYQLTYTIFRYFNVYGPRQSTKTSAAIPTIIDQTLKNNKITVIGGTQKRDFIFVKDVAKANLLACQKNIQGIFNIGTGKQTSINRIVAHIIKLTKKKPTIIYSLRDTADADSSKASIRKVKKQLDWHPETTLAEGLKETVMYYMKEK